jgi:hypothetical protein
LGTFLLPSLRSVRGHDIRVRVFAIIAINLEAVRN